MHAEVRTHMTLSMSLSSRKACGSGVLIVAVFEQDLLFARLSDPSEVAESNEARDLLKTRCYALSR